MNNLKKMLKVINILVSIVLVVVILAAAYLAFSARFSKDNIPQLGGYRFLTVLSGSMEPAIRTGDVIAVRPYVRGEQIKEGDVITFRTREKADMLITHRVMGVVMVNGEQAAYVTKGDANNSEDLSAVAVDQVMGIYRWRIPYLGLVTSLLHKPAGIIIFVILPGLVLIAQESVKIWKVLAAAEAAKKGGGEQPRT